MDDNNEAADETAGGDALAGDLPEETDAGTRTRLAEIFDRSPISQIW